MNLYFYDSRNGHFSFVRIKASEISHFVNEIRHFLGFQAHSKNDMHHFEGIQQSGMLLILQIWSVVA